MQEQLFQLPSNFLNQEGNGRTSSLIGEPPPIDARRLCRMADDRPSNFDVDWDVAQDQDGGNSSWWELVLLQSDEAPGGL